MNEILDDNKVKYVLFYIFRVIGYGLVMYLLNLVYFHDATHITATGKFGEISFTEILQEAFLFLSGLIFIFVARFDKDLTAIANLISVFFFMSFIREFNNQIDFWFYLVLPLIALFAWLFFRDRKKIFDSIHQLLRIPATAYLVTGFLITFIFSRLFGRTKLWQAILETDYNRWAKNAAEEGIELLGYTFFFIASVEILISVLNRKKQLEK